MYESFYRLAQRPFAAAPDPNLFVASPAVSEALTRLERCVRQARGVAVLTGAAGIGKTHLLHRLFDMLQSEFGVIRVPNASFPSPRGFLQFLLAECGADFERMGETELRLRLVGAANDALATTGGIVLLMDETHRFSERLLEEVRLTANHVESGQPLFRIVMAGQVSLEDRLAEAGQTGLNERIGELVTLPRLTAEESRMYLATRASQAEGALEELFEPAAIEIMVQACGGIPRCLNQLADHALLLGFVAERATVSESLVREALEDLKRLPLQWHDPIPRGSEGETGRRGDRPDADESFGDVVEIGSLDDGEFDSEESSDDEWTPAPESTSEWDDEASSRSLHPEEMPVCHVPEPAPPMEHISDRFARLDAVNAQRRWLDAWERAEREDGRSRQEIAGTEKETDAKMTAEPMDDDCEPKSDAPERGESVARGTWDRVPKSPTMFRDLRRRQGLT